jgi:protein-tyrosine phosphatase
MGSRQPVDEDVLILGNIFLIVEHLLFICTGNICRSPMAQAIATRLLEARDARVTVSGAGSLGSGLRCPPEARAVMRMRGLDLSSHRSRTVIEALGATPDLIVGMAREHVRRVTDFRPELFIRTFTLKELVRHATQEKRRQPNEGLDAYIVRIQHGRRPWDLSGTNVDDDIADPIGRSKRAYERCAAEIEGLVRMLVDSVWPLANGDTQSLS